MIKVITYPDILYDKSKKILLIVPGSDVEQEFQEKVLEKTKEPLHVYHSHFSNDEDKIKWMLTVFSLCDFVIVNLDNIHDTHRELLGYFLSFPKTYYLTKGNSSLYNSINPNQIYNLDFVEKMGIIEYEK